jgi:tetratricopeptide (TPR) repeat protein
MQIKKIFQIFIFTISITSCDVISIEKYYTIASELESQGRLEEAIIYHNKILKKDSKFRPSLINRGADKSGLGDFIGAIQDYKKILEFDPDNLLAIVNIGNSYENLHDFDSAIIYYSKALNSNPRNITQIRLYNDFDQDYHYQIDKYELLFERGTAYLLNQQYEKAISDLNKLIETGDMVGDANYYIGEAYLKLNDTLNAKKFLIEAKNFGMIEAKDLLYKIDTN